MLTEQQQFTVDRLKEFNKANTPDEIIRWCLEKISGPGKKRKVTFKKNGNKNSVGKGYFFAIIDHFVGVKK